ncbi:MULTISPECIES: PLP-dependent aspartate aminotransferase family protein [Oceanithermus]|uniref:Methionine gamma-lyase n=3 Tax=Oceanithermus TaxID=208447 RepID=A0A511RKQ4_9DEIN|nr:MULTISPECIES: PLP-dependent aspartate aminotransferase family protein [Oceanithermus]MBB6028702.1 methionine-gamma-lyase [Oceanithermus desulfurans]GEM90254.1 methionine gamma-lyase [Oceanithermus desulfurans NBRC 100063]
MKRFRTRALHVGSRPDPATGAHVTPVYRTSTFAYGSFDRGARMFAGEESGYVYTRIGNPTVRVFEEKLANLEGAEDAVAFASGMAAIAALTLTFLQPGDELAFLGPLYGGTEGLFLETLTRFGIQVRDVSEEPPSAWVGPRTRMLYVETPTNPTLRIHDLAQVGEVGRAHGVLTVADNTFATPYLTRPLEFGLDVVVHSATKYLGGHGDAIGGVVAGPGEMMQELRMHGLRHVGGAMSPEDAFLFMRGIKTLALRMEAHCDGAEAVAAYLARHPAVARVYYPGLPQHPGHEVAARQMDRYGGMVALELHGGFDAARVFLDGLELFTQAVSLGDVESLATHPASTTHELLPPEVLERQGITPGLVRLSVGIEDPRDLTEDLEQALARVERSLVS